MPIYRIYRVEDGGRLALGDTFSEPDDGAALAAVLALHRAGEALELWCGGRLVGRVSKLGVFTANP